MNRRTFVAVVGGAVVILSPGLSGQGQVTTRRIGYLSAFARADVETFLGLLKPELAKFEWTDGRNVVLLEPRTTEGRNELLPSMASELVSHGPDLIMVQTAPATRAAMQATKSIPIVMVGVGDPVGYGIVADFGKPGGNVTGSSYLADESTRKLLQLLKEAAPRLRSVALFSNPSNEGAAAMVKQMRAAGVALGMQVQAVDVSGKGDFDSAFAAIRRENTESILLPPESLIRSNRSAIAGFAQTHGLPLAIVGSRLVLPANGLMSYGPTTVQYAQLTARYIDRILRGSNQAIFPSSNRRGSNW